MGTNDYQHAAARYALREITGTDALAFHALAERFATLGLSGKALDLGCGSGRSTRFLKALQFQTVGLDVSEAMIAEARKLDPGGTYLSYRANEPLPFEEASFDVLISTWVVLELRARADLDTFLGEVARVLKPEAKGFIVADTPEFYQHRWVSCEVDFPENKAPLQSGQLVKARLMPEGVVVTDVFWSDQTYREALAGAGLDVVQCWYPKASAAETHWLDETNVAPWVIYEVEKAR
ncbi:MAG TPA: class I SAM-dependent methyltransferase [Rhodothermales bacterium]|nr:class I SAM-dependent methyltransferase [Rhodothermales bacterium]